jgi:hypothetical protein
LHWESEGDENVKNEKLVRPNVPKFRTEDEEATWWASQEGREFVKRKSATGPSKKQKGSSLVPGLSRANSVQIALKRLPDRVPVAHLRRQWRLPALDLAKAREIAERKGIVYQTLLKMLVHEGLRWEARRE